MSNFWVTEDGFIKRTYEDNKTFYEDGYKSIFGESIDLEPEGPFGQLVAFHALRDTNLWDGAEEVYNSRNPNAATGVSLDWISAETGIIRQAASKTQVLNVFLYGSLGTNILTGNQARQSSNPDEIDYLLLSDVSISLLTVRTSDVQIGSPSDTEVFTITIDATPYTHVATVPTEDASDVAAALKVLIDAGVFAGSVVQTDDILKIEQVELDYTLAITGNISLELIAAGGDFEADFTGANTVPSITLDTIVTPVSGWESVSNPQVGLTGRERETDAELRVRRANTLTTGNATEDAIVANISNNVTGVTQVSISSNRSNVTDGEGLPPKSFRAVVTGGDDDDIAQQIWLTQPAGIESFGTEAIVVVDSEGNNQTVYFSRPTAVYIHVKVKRDLYSEEDYPANGDQLIKDNIVAWALINQPIGKDVIRQRLASPVYEVPGIEDIEITIDGTPNPGDTPTYALQNVVIDADEFADFADARITVEDLTP